MCCWLKVFSFCHKSSHAFIKRMTIFLWQAWWRHQLLWRDVIVMVTQSDDGLGFGNQGLDAELLIPWWFRMRLPGLWCPLMLQYIIFAAGSVKSLSRPTLIFWSATVYYRVEYYRWCCSFVCEIDELRCEQVCILICCPQLCTFIHNL